MTVSKLNPWNWFKKEREQETPLPVKQSERETAPVSPLDQFHAELDRMVETMFSGFGLRPRLTGSLFDTAAIKPHVDVYGTGSRYVIEAELPGVEEKDLSLELRDNVLVLTAERTHEKTTDEKGYYRMERSRGSYRRVFDIPDDADRDHISATLNKGVLCVTMPRTGQPAPSGRTIAIEKTPSA